MDFNKFFTEVKLDKFPFQKIEKTSILTGIGSCFAEKFLQMLSMAKMSVAINPSGIIYNLHSMHEIIMRVIENRPFSDSEVDCVNGRFILWSHHGSFGANSADDVLHAANEALINFQKELSQSELLLLTPSSSVVYRHLKSNRIVANCHKANNNEFQVELLSASENARLLKEILQAVKKFNSGCKVIVSLSPIRHYPGNLILNNRSKANLLSGIYDVLEGYSEMAAYFPAYEILHDELRDYRFYAKDMLHLSEFAEEYILQKFCQWSMTEDCQKFIAEAEKRKKLELHRPKY